MRYYDFDKKEFLKKWTSYFTDAKGMTKASMARRLKIMPQYLNSIINGDKNVSDKFFNKFICEFNISDSQLSIKQIAADENNKPTSIDAMINGLPEGEEIQNTIKEESFDYLVDNVFNLLKEKDMLIRELTEENSMLKFEIKSLKAKSNQCD